MAKQCQWHQGCNEAPVPTERFCPLHRKAMLRQMEDSGYLQPLPTREPARHRPDERVDPVMQTAVEQGNYP